MAGDLPEGAVVAKYTFVITFISAVLFIAAVFVFIL